MKIGIPRALNYYRYYPFWQCYLQNLGCQTVVSDQTTKKTVDVGIASTVDGLCLPSKTYVGHVANLMEKNVDCIFVPRIISIAKSEYICPKFMGLPDIVRNSLPKCPPLLAPVIDGRRNGSRILRAYLAMGRKFAPASRVALAYSKAIQAQHRAEAAREIWDESPRQTQTLATGHHLVLGILGHEYLLNDDYLNMGTLKWLRETGCQIVTMEEIKEAVIDRLAKEAPKRMFWTPGKRIFGAVAYFCRWTQGIISLSAFTCGTDSLAIDLVERFCSRRRMPHLQLSLDEHTGMAGVFTRLEAFLELLSRRKGIEINYSTHG